jgi:pilus assembly protein CpaB
MNVRALILLVVAVVIAVATVIVIRDRDQPVTSTGTKVLIASSNISAGSFVHSDKDLAWADWPAASIAPSFITSDAHKIEEYNGGVARRSIMAGEPVTSDSIVRASEGGFMSAVLAPGKRAVSIAVSPTSGNAGFIFPGDKVDLILTHRIPIKDGGGDVLASETFVEDVRVLAIDQMLDNPDNKAVIAKTITLEVSPRQAEMVNVATSLGSISVSLRSLANTPSKKGQAASVANTYSTDNDVSKLMGNDKVAVHDKVSIFHGSTSEQIDFHGGQQR